MKKFLIAAVAVATIAGAAGAASAQPYGGPHGPDRGYSDGFRGDDRGGRGGYEDRDYRGGYGPGAINARLDEIARRIARGERSGRLDRREARWLRNDLVQINTLERQFRMSRGLDRREIVILSMRLDRLERQVFAEMRDGRRYGEGYGGGYDRH